MAAAALPLHPRHPERICWGCERLCPADDLGCGGGTVRAPHPIELFGEDWLEWSKVRNENGPERLAPMPAPAVSPESGSACREVQYQSHAQAGRWIHEVSGHLISRK
ncbi:MAG TPA: DUF3079 domain-containing protein [Vicinamibacterales bacterium]